MHDPNSFLNPQTNQRVRATLVLYHPNPPFSFSPLARSPFPPCAPPFFHSFSLPLNDYVRIVPAGLTPAPLSPRSPSFLSVPFSTLLLQPHVLSIPVVPCVFFHAVRIVLRFDNDQHPCKTHLLPIEPLPFFFKPFTIENNGAVYPYLSSSTTRPCSSIIIEDYVLSSQSPTDGYRIASHPHPTARILSLRGPCTGHGLAHWGFTHWTYRIGTGRSCFLLQTAQLSFSLPCPCPRPRRRNTWRHKAWKFPHPFCPLDLGPRHKPFRHPPPFLR